MLSPDVVVVSGDLTQRAKISEFEAAKAFIDALKNCGMRVLVIPGNHDIHPLYRPLSRLRKPFERYAQYFGSTIEPHYEDSELAIVAMNTVNPKAVMNGLIRKHNLERALQWIERRRQKNKIIVTHQPMHLPVRHKKFRKRIVSRGSASAIEQLLQRGVFAFLSGHHHIPATGILAALRDPTHSALSLQAGTVSDREGEGGKWFTLITIYSAHTTVAQHKWIPAKHGFRKMSLETFEKTGRTWKRK